jgi:hypothetical protein
VKVPGPGGTSVHVKFGKSPIIVVVLLGFCIFVSVRITLVSSVDGALNILNVNVKEYEFVVPVVMVVPIMESNLTLSSETVVVTASVITDVKVPLAGIAGVV